jgi:HEPN domain-containing protein
VLWFKPDNKSMTAKLIASFFELAEDGLKTANILFREDQFRDSAYHAQQVAEHVARALLTHAGKPFGTSQNLGQMAEVLPVDHPFKIRIKAFDQLSPAATKFRYPSPTGRLADPPSIDAIRKILDDLATLLRDARTYVCGPQPDAAANPRPKGSERS